MIQDKAIVVAGTIGAGAFGMMAEAIPALPAESNSTLLLFIQGGFATMLLLVLFGCFKVINQIMADASRRETALMLRLDDQAKMFTQALDVREKNSMVFVEHVRALSEQARFCPNNGGQRIPRLSRGGDDE